MPSCTTASASTRQALAGGPARQRGSRATSRENWALPELIEAAARTGRTGIARRRPELGWPRPARPAGTDLGLGIDGALTRAAERRATTAEGRYREAIERLGRTPGARRARPRPPALRGVAAPREPPRGRPRAAADRPRACSTTMGMEAFAERARRELLATGESVRQRTAGPTPATLTAQEAHIARLAARRAHQPGDRRPAVPVSPRTVEWHLRRCSPSSASAPPAAPAGPGRSASAVADQKIAFTPNY